MDQVYQLLYTSFSSDSFQSTHDIDEILKVARDYNAEKNISGLLMYKGGIFIQLLEGKEVNVQELFIKIRKDPRHEKISIIWESDNQKRLFQNWAMAFKKSDLYDVSAQEKMEDFLALANNRMGLMESKDVKDFLRYMRTQL